jgi:hypothetical protein
MPPGTAPLSPLQNNSRQEEPANANTDDTGKLPAEFGESGNIIWKGLLTGDDYNHDFNYPRAYKTYDEMRRSDPTVKASLNLLKLPIIGADWHIEPASDDAKDKLVASNLHYNLFERNSFKQIINNFATGGLAFGHYVAEKVIDMEYWVGDEDGKGKGKYWTLQKLAGRRQDTIHAWEQVDGTPGITQITTDKTVSIPAEKLVIYTHEREGDNYVGMSVLRTAYKNWYHKSSLEKIASIGAERQAVGVPYVKPPADAKQADRAKAQEAARNMRANQNAYVEIPLGWELGFLDMNAPSTMKIDELTSYHDRRILLNVLGQFLDFGSTGASGSRATSEDQSKILTQSLESIASAIAEVIQENLIKQLVDLNFSVTKYPKLRYGRLEDENIELLSGAIKSLSDAGMLTPDAETEAYLRKTMRLPEMSDDLKKKREAEEKAAKTTKTPPTKDKADAEQALEDAKKAKEALLKAIS